MSALTTIQNFLSHYAAVSRLSLPEIPPSVFNPSLRDQFSLYPLILGFKQTQDARKGGWLQFQRANPATYASTPLTGLVSPELTTYLKRRATSLPDDLPIGDLSDWAKRRRDLSADDRRLVAEVSDLSKQRYAALRTASLDYRQAVGKGITTKAVMLITESRKEEGPFYLRIQRVGYSTLEEMTGKQWVRLGGIRLPLAMNLLPFMQTVLLNSPNNPGFEIYADIRTKGDTLSNAIEKVHKLESGFKASAPEIVQNPKSGLKALSRHLGLLAGVLLCTGVLLPSMAHAAENNPSPPQNEPESSGFANFALHMVLGALSSKAETALTFAEMIETVIV